MELKRAFTKRMRYGSKRREPPGTLELPASHGAPAQLGGSATPSPSALSTPATEEFFSIPFEEAAPSMSPHRPLANQRANSSPGGPASSALGDFRSGPEPRALFPSTSPNRVRSDSASVVSASASVMASPTQASSSRPSSRSGSLSSSAIGRNSRSGSVSGAAAFGGPHGQASAATYSPVVGAGVTPDIRRPSYASEISRNEPPAPLILPGGVIGPHAGANGAAEPPTPTSITAPLEDLSDVESTADEMAQSILDKVQGSEDKDDEKWSLK